MAVSQIAQKIVGMVVSPKSTEQASQSQATASLAPVKKTGISSQYDVRNMSPDELVNMIQEMHNAGLLSDRDKMTLERTSQEGLSGVSKDAKMDMLSFFERQVGQMKAMPAARGIDNWEHSLEILQGVQARAGANLPATV